MIQSIVAMFTADGCGEVGESLTAERLSDGLEPDTGLWVITCIPVMADLNQGDVVLCSEDPERVPHVLSRVSSTGSTTIFFSFQKFMRRDRHLPRITEELQELGATIEQVARALWALNVPVDAKEQIETKLEENAPYVRWWRAQTAP